MSAWSNSSKHWEQKKIYVVKIIMKTISSNFTLSMINYNENNAWNYVYMSICKPPVITWKKAYSTSLTLKKKLILHAVCHLKNTANWIFLSWVGPCIIYEVVEKNSDQLTGQYYILLWVMGGKGRWLTSTKGNTYLPETP